VAAGELVLLSGSDGVVRALEARSGKERWTATTGGDVRLPPTIWRGRAFVGSGDGWVYSYEASTGRPLWRFRAAPAERKIPVYGRLLSTWPAASGVLVQDGTAYVAAGIVNYDGTYVYALDAETGAVQWLNDTSGHLDPEAQSGVSVQGHLLLYGEKLYLAGGNAVSPAVYDVRDGRCLNDAAPLARCESTSPRGWELFLVGERVIACGKPYYTHPDIPVYDHTVTKKLLHATSGVYDVVWLDGARIACFPRLDRDELTRGVTDERIPRHITQAWGAFRVSEEPHWVRQCPESVAVAVARNAAVVAGPEDVVAWSLADGSELWRLPLPAAPVPWGVAIDSDGRVILTLTDGRVTCVAPAP
jgi:outer membrane protein assembly factor BamB